MNFLKKKWLQSRWIGNPPLAEGELLRQSKQVKQGLVMGMRLAVLEEQAAAVVVEGRLITVFLPGAYQLEQDKMPPLPPAPKCDWLFPAQLYFLNMGVFAGQPWQPQCPLLTRDPQRGLLQLMVTGVYTAQVENASVFMQAMVIGRGFYDWAGLHTYLCGRLNDLAVAQAARQDMPLERLAKLREKLGQALCQEMNRELRGSGLILREVRVQTLELHHSLERLIKEQQDHPHFNQALRSSIVG